jgi:hypothetical protein
MSVLKIHLQVLETGQPEASGSERRLRRRPVSASVAAALRRRHAIEGFEARRAPRLVRLRARHRLQAPQGPVRLEASGARRCPPRPCTRPGRRQHRNGSHCAVVENAPFMGDSRNVVNKKIATAEKDSRHQRGRHRLRVPAVRHGISVPLQQKPDISARR